MQAAIAAAAFMGYTVAKTFNITENEVANRAYGLPAHFPELARRGSPALYPFPPMNLTDDPIYSNSTMLGNLVAVGAFLASYR
eukprot:4570847-Pyramimonas_sp.AAC.2